MKSCLFIVAGAILVLAVGAWLVLPRVAGLVLASALRSGGVTGTDVAVTVDANPPFALLLGRADAVHVRGSGVTLRDLRAASLQMTLYDVSVFDRRFARVHAQLDGAVLTAVSGQTVPVSRIVLDGGSRDATAELTVQAADATRLAEDRLREAAGIDATITFAAPNTVRIAAASVSGTGRLLVRGGALVLAPAIAGLPEVTLIEPGPDNPLVVTAVAVDSTSIRVSGTLDVEALAGLP